jgi:hypothetical protein
MPFALIFPAGSGHDCRRAFPESAASPSGAKSDFLSIVPLHLAGAMVNGEW